LEGHDHDAVMRIGGRFRGGGSNLQDRHKGQGGHRRTATSDRLGSPQPAKQPPGAKQLRSYKAPWLMGQGFMTAATIQSATGFSTTPAGTSPVMT
jgi:hypothetical protein